MQQDFFLILIKYYEYLWCLLINNEKKIFKMMDNENNFDILVTLFWKKKMS